MDGKVFVPLVDLFGFNVQPLTKISRTLFQPSAFLGDVSSDEDLCAISELGSDRIAYNTIITRLNAERS